MRQNFEHQIYHLRFLHQKIISIWSLLVIVLEYNWYSFTCFVSINFLLKLSLKMDTKPCFSWLISCGDVTHINSEIPRNNERYSPSFYYSWETIVSVSPKVNKQQFAYIFGILQLSHLKYELTLSHYNLIFVKGKSIYHRQCPKSLTETNKHFIQNYKFSQQTALQK